MACRGSGAFAFAEDLSVITLRAYLALERRLQSEELSRWVVIATATSWTRRTMRPVEGRIQVSVGAPFGDGE